MFSILQSSPDNDYKSYSGTYRFILYDRERDLEIIRSEIWQNDNAESEKKGHSNWKVIVMDENDS